MAVIAVSAFERMFREAADLDVDKNDLKRYQDFIHQKIGDLLIRAEATAKANGRDVIELRDLPITKGLQETIHEYRRLERTLELRPMLAALAVRPLLDLAVADETDAALPEIAGALSVALGRTFRIIDPQSRNPSTEHWERAFRIFDLLL
jgi:histone H3/H4